MIVAKIQGDIEPKKQYQVFFSHSKTDKPFADFFDKLLRDKGAKEEEIFYTSREGNAKKFDNVQDLGTIIKSCIIRQNTLLFYLIGYDYKKSEFCMFEGGAGWATRSVGEYPILSIKYEHIPQFLTNKKAEFGLMNAGTIALSADNYVFIVKVLNRIINHLNKGREIRHETFLDLFQEQTIPDKLDLVRQDKTAEDFMNPTIKECWKTYVVPHLQEYLAAMREAEHKQQLQLMIVADQSEASHINSPQNAT